MAEGASRRRFGDAARTVGANVAIRLAMATDGRRRWRRMQAQVDDPAGVQNELLASILADNADTMFGRDHGFAAVRSGSESGGGVGGGSGNPLDRYRELVPAQNHTSLLPYIEAQEQTGDGLTTEQPILYARTSGTTGTPKDIPVTASTVDRLAATQRLYSFELDRSTDAFRGRVLGIGGAAMEGNRPSGTPFGSATGLIYEQMPKVVQAKYVLPPAALGIEDYETKYAVIAAMALASADLTSIATANPSTVARLVAVIEDRWDELLAAVANGDPSGLGPLSEVQRTAVRDWSRPRPERARELERLGRSNDGAARRDIGRLWPRLAALVGWTGGACGFALEGLKPLLSDRTMLMEYGYSASEFRGTIGFDTGRFGIPTIWDNHFEFVSAEERETIDGSGGTVGPERFLGIEELEVGRQYYLYVTTPDGLYRYDMNDVMEAGPRYRATPTLAFVRKGRGTTNITGEKVTEEQVLAAMSAASDESGVTVGFFVALAHTDGANYEFLIEPVDGGPGIAGPDIDPSAMAAELERFLAETNVEYKAKRASGRLGPVKVTLLRPGAGAAHRKAKVASGQRDAQFKHLHLQPAEGFGFDFRVEGFAR